MCEEAPQNSIWNKAMEEKVTTFEHSHTWEPAKPRYIKPIYC